MSKKIIDLASGSITDSGLTYIGDPITGTLNRLSYKQIKDYAQSGFVSYDPSNLNLYTSSNDTNVTILFAFNDFFVDTIVDLWNFTGSILNFTSSIQSQVNNVYASESVYLLSSSFNTFTSSYFIDSASFNNRINNITGSVFNTGSLLLTSSFQSYTSSNDIRVSNVFASESNYLPTSSFITFSSSYVTDSSSFLSKITNASTQVSNIDGTLTILPISGSVTASLNLGNVNTWTGKQNFNSIGSSTGMQFTSPGGAGTGLNGIAFNFGTYTGVSSFPRAYEIQGAYTAASGTGIFSALRFAHTLNQSGGTGAVWGIWYNPTITAAIDHVAIQLSSGRSVFNELSLGADMTKTVPTWLNIAASTTVKSQISLASGSIPTSPNNGDIWFDSSNIFNFNGGGSIIQNASGVSQPAGFTLINNTSASVSVNQNPGYISFVGNAWKTNAVAGSQPWVVNLVANANTGTANALPNFIIGASANGVGLLNWLTLTSTAATIQSLGTIVLSNNGGVHLNCSGNRTIMQNAQVWVNNKLAAGNGGAFDPTAKVHIGGGTATAATAPLKFTAGTNMTVPEVGSMEYNGINLFFTRSGSVREDILTTPLVSTVSPTAPNRTIKVNIDGTDYFIAAKTTND